MFFDAVLMAAGRIHTSADTVRRMTVDIH